MELSALFRKFGDVFYVRTSTQRKLEQKSA